MKKLVIGILALGCLTSCIDDAELLTKEKGVKKADAEFNPFNPSDSTKKDDKKTERISFPEIN